MLCPAELKSHIANGAVAANGRFDNELAGSNLLRSNDCSINENGEPGMKRCVAANAWYHPSHDNPPRTVGLRKPEA
jgi:hypothetical protein